jgi:hypothetical protein
VLQVSGGHSAVREADLGPVVAEDSGPAVRAVDSGPVVAATPPRASSKLKIPDEPTANILAAPPANAAPISLKGILVQTIRFTEHTEAKNPVLPEVIDTPSADLQETTAVATAVQENSAATCEAAPKTKMSATVEEKVADMSSALVPVWKAEEIEESEAKYDRQDFQLFAKS